MISCVTRVSYTYTKWRNTLFRWSGMAITRGETPSGGAPSQLSRREVPRATYEPQPREISPTTAMRWGPRPEPKDPPSSCNAFGFTWVPKGEPTTRCKIEKKCLGQNVSRLWLFRRILSAPGSLSPTRLRLASGLGICFEPLRCDTPALYLTAAGSDPPSSHTTRVVRHLQGCWGRQTE